MPDPTIPPTTGVEAIVEFWRSRCHAAESALAAAWVEVERLVRDSCDDHTHLQDACRKAGIAERLIVGDSYGVPGIGDLADMLTARVATLEAALRPFADRSEELRLMQGTVEGLGRISSVQPVKVEHLIRAAAVLAEKP